MQFSSNLTLRNIKYICVFLSFLKTEMAQVFKIYLNETSTKDTFIPHNQWHCYWWPGDARFHVISNNCINLVITEYSGLRPRSWVQIHWHNIWLCFTYEISFLLLSYLIVLSSFQRTGHSIFINVRTYVILVEHITYIYLGVILITNLHMTTSRTWLPWMWGIWNLKTNSNVPTISKTKQIRLI